MSRELFREVSRRDFLKICGGVAAALGLSEMSASEVAEVLAASAKKPPVVWLEFGSCSGCSTSFLNADSPNAVDVILNHLSVRYIEVIMAAQGAQTEEVLHETIEKEAGNYIAVIEGAVPTLDGYGMIADRNFYDVLKEVAAKAKAVIALGSCAAYGGIPAAKPNPGQVKPVSEIIGKEKVINIPGCAANPSWLISTVVHVLMFGMPELDSFGRPKFIYGQCIHDNCERRASFDEGMYVEKYGDIEVGRDYCLVKVGCKGPNTHSNCPQIRWNGSKSWCVAVGAGCIGCVEPSFPDAFMPFHDRLPDLALPGWAGIRADADLIGTVLGAATAIGIGVHAVGAAAKGKLGKRAAHEEQAKTEA